MTERTTDELDPELDVADEALAERLEADSHEAPAAGSDPDRGRPRRGRLAAAADRC